MQEVMKDAFKEAKTRVKRVKYYFQLWVTRATVPKVRFEKIALQMTLSSKFRKHGDVTCG